MRFELSLSFETSGHRRQFPYTKAQVGALLKALLRELKVTPEFQKTSARIGTPSSLGVHLCGDDQMRALQLQFRQIDRATDVLSFCAREEEAPRFDGYLGEVVLSVDTVSRHARRYRRSVKKEYAKVLIHSLLHLLGFEHVSVSMQRRQRMRQLERRLERLLSREFPKILS